MTETTLGERERALAEKEALIQARMDELGIKAPPPPLPDELVQRMNEMIRVWGRKGHPQKAAQLRRHLASSTKPPAELMSTGPVKPELAVDDPDDLEIPPRNGKGATAKTWREFASTVADIEEEVLQRMGREDIIVMLESKRIIPKETSD